MDAYIPVISVWSMITIGIILMALEMLTATFVLFFFGLAFLLVGIIGVFHDFTSGEIQLIWTFSVGLVLSLVLAKPLRQKIYSTEPLKLETLESGATGEVQLTNDGDYRVRYKGTTWAIGNLKEYPLENGQTVIVERLENNQAFIRIQER